MQSAVMTALGFGFVTPFPQQADDVKKKQKKQ